MHTQLLGQHCKLLLDAHDCVIIPGFGGLISRTVSAWYSDEREQFFPPSRDVQFNRSLQQDDGKLVHSVSSALGAGADEVRAIIASVVENVIKELEASGKVAVAHLGQFSLGIGGEFLFQPSSELLILVPFYGFPAVAVPPLESYRRKELVRAAVERYSKHTAAIAAGIALFIGLNLVPLHVTRQSQVQQQKAMISIQQKQVDYSAESRDSIATLIDALTQKSNALSMDRQDEAAPEKAVADKEPQTEIQPEKTADKPVQESKTVSPVKQNDQDGYYLIAGSFVEMWRADTYIAEMKAKGFDPMVVKTDEKIRVALQFHTNRNDAETRMKAFRDSNPEIPVWLLKK